MYEKQLYGDRDFDQLDHVRSKNFCAQIVNKCLDYKTHTFNFLCLSDSGRQKHFFPTFSVFDMQKIQLFAKKSIASIRSGNLNIFYR